MTSMLGTVRLQGSMARLCLATVTIVFGVLQGASAEPGVLREYCEDSEFRAECPEGQVVLMQEARYGRMRLGECLIREYGSLGCFSDMLSRFDGWCSGRRSCEVAVHEILGSATSCLSDLRSYLEARYTCVPVVSPGEHCCQISGERVQVETGSGFIASSITMETGCGGIDCPWILRAPEGQRFNISVYDFAPPTHDSELSSEFRKWNVGSACSVNAIIKEESIGSAMTLCAGEQRHKRVYTTSTNSVELRIVTKNRELEDSTHFLIEFEVFGCPDPTPPAHGFAKRYGQRAVVGCLAPDDTRWDITCRGVTWAGHTGNCSAAGGPDVGGLLNNIMHLSPDVSIVIITVVALLIAVGILVIGVVCLRRRWGRQRFTRKQKKLPAPPLPARGSRQSSYSAREDKRFIQVESPLPGEHNYFRTWELPRQLPRQPGTHIEPPGDIPQFERDYDTGYYTDHIYESPTFEHRDFIDGGVEQYYELDPETEPFNPVNRYTDNSRVPRLTSHDKPQRCSYPNTTTSEKTCLAPGSFTS